MVLGVGQEPGTQFSLPPILSVLPAMISLEKEEEGQSVSGAKSLKMSIV